MNSCCSINMTKYYSIRKYLQHTPVLGERVYIDPSAVLIGKVQVGNDVSFWPGAVARGDLESIRVGDYTNVQDNATLHVTHDGPYSPGGFPLTVGSYVTVGHNAILHACTVGDRCLIGMGAIVMDGAVIEDQAMVAAGSIVSPGERVTGKELWLGRPARAIRLLSDRELDMLEYSARHYARLKDQYLSAGPPETDA